MNSNKTYDVVIIGGGFYGLSIAIYLSERLGVKKILVVEKEKDYLQRASYSNQARVHNGYHYPRSLLTGVRSRVNFPDFVSDYAEAICSDFDKYYAVAKQFSKVSATQFRIFSERIGSDIVTAPAAVKKLFNSHMIEEVFKVKEYAFNAKVLKQILLKRVERLDVELLSGTEVTRVQDLPKGGIVVELGSGASVSAHRVYNATYSMINHVNRNSGLPTIPLKHELVEMCLVELPSILHGLSVTVMDGPFFSFMPFPDRGLSTLSHVRYTPHSEWHDAEGALRHGHRYVDEEVRKVSHYEQMKADVLRYMPAFKGAIHRDSLWEVKTVLPKSEGDDSRPILYKDDYGMKGYTVIMGGKIDNIYDVFKELDLTYGQS